VAILRHDPHNATLYNMLRSQLVSTGAHASSLHTHLERTLAPHRIAATEAKRLVASLASSLSSPRSAANGTTENAGPSDAGPDSQAFQALVAVLRGQHQALTPSLAHAHAVGSSDPLCAETQAGAARGAWKHAVALSLEALGRNSNSSSGPGGDDAGGRNERAEVIRRTVLSALAASGTPSAQRLLLHLLGHCSRHTTEGGFADIAIDEIGKVEAEVHPHLQLQLEQHEQLTVEEERNHVLMTMLQLREPTVFTLAALGELVNAVLHRRRSSSKPSTDTNSTTNRGVPSSHRFSQAQGGYLLSVLGTLVKHYDRAECARRHHSPQQRRQRRQQRRQSLQDKDAWAAVADLDYVRTTVAVCPGSQFTRKLLRPVVGWLRPQSRGIMPTLQQASLPPYSPPKKKRRYERHGAASATEQLHAVRCLANSGHTAFLPELQRLIAHGQGEARLAAVRGLKYVCPEQPDVGPFLWSVVTEHDAPEHDVRYEALQAILQRDAGSGSVREPEELLPITRGYSLLHEEFEERRKTARLRRQQQGRVSHLAAAAEQAAEDVERLLQLLEGHFSRQQERLTQLHSVYLPTHEHSRSSSSLSSSASPHSQRQILQEAGSRRVHRQLEKIAGRAGRDGTAGSKGMRFRPWGVEDGGILHEPLGRADGSSSASGNEDVEQQQGGQRTATQRVLEETLKQFEREHGPIDEQLRNASATGKQSGPHSPTMRRLQGFFKTFTFDWAYGLHGDIGFYEHKTLFEIGNSQFGAKAWATTDNIAYATFPWEGPIAFGVGVVNEAVLNIFASVAGIDLSYDVIRAEYKYSQHQEIQKGDIPIEEIKDAWDTAVAGYSVYACTKPGATCTPDYRTLVEMAFKYIVCFGGEQIGMDVSRICGSDFDIDCLFDQFVPADGDMVVAWNALVGAPVEAIVAMATDCYGFPEMYAHLIYEIHDVILESAADAAGRRRRRLSRNQLRMARNASTAIADNVTDFQRNRLQKFQQKQHRVHTAETVSNRVMRGLPSPHDTTPSRRLESTGMTVLTKAPAASFIHPISFRPPIEVQASMKEDYNGFFHHIEDGGEMGDTILDQHIVPIENAHLDAIILSGDDSSTSLDINSANHMRAFFRFIRCGGVLGSVSSVNKDSDGSDMRPPTDSLNNCPSVFPDLNIGNSKPAGGALAGQWDGYHQSCGSSDDCNCANAECEDGKCVCAASLQITTADDQAKWENQSKPLVGTKIRLLYDTRCNEAADTNCDKGYLVVTDVVDTLDNNTFQAEVGVGPEGDCRGKDGDYKKGCGWHGAMYPTYSLTLSTINLDGDYNPLSGNRQIGIMRICEDSLFHPLDGDDACPAESDAGWHLFYRGAHTLTSQTIEDIFSQEDSQEDSRRLMDADEEDEIETEIETDKEAASSETADINTAAEKGGGGDKKGEQEDEEDKKDYEEDEEDEEDDEKKPGLEHIGPLLQHEVGRPGRFKYTSHATTHPTLGKQSLDYDVEVHPKLFSLEKESKTDFVECEDDTLTVWFKSRVVEAESWGCDEGRFHNGELACTVVVGSPHWGCTGGTEEHLAFYNPVLSTMNSPVLRRLTGNATTVSAHTLLRQRIALHRANSQSEANLEAEGNPGSGSGFHARLAQDYEEALESGMYANHFVVSAPARVATYADVFLQAKVAFLHDEAQATATASEKQRWQQAHRWEPKRTFRERRRRLDEATGLDPTRHYPYSDRHVHQHASTAAHQSGLNYADQSIFDSDTNGNTSNHRRLSSTGYSLSMGINCYLQGGTRGVLTASMGCRVGVLDGLNIKADSPDIDQMQPASPLVRPCSRCHTIRTIYAV
jgi:hypothetical protein